MQTRLLASVAATAARGVRAAAVHRAVLPLAAVGALRAFGATTVVPSAATAVAAAAAAAAAPAAASTTPTIPHSDLAYRSLMRNLRLLAGQRGPKTPLRALVVGPGAPEVAARFRALEPAAEVTTGDMTAVDAAAGAGLDAIVVCQVYHSLRTPADLAAIHAALDEEEGAVGFIWHRALPTPSPTPGVVPAGSAAAGLVPAMPAGGTPMAWMEALNAPAFQFKPIRHRKFVETVTPPTPAAAAALLSATHDARTPFAPAPDAAVPAAITFDLHAFHTTVVPVLKKKSA